MADYDLLADHHEWASGSAATDPGAFGNKSERMDARPGLGRLIEKR